MCTLCHSATLLITGTCTAVVAPTGVDRLDVKDKLTCIHAMAGLPSTSGRSRRWHAEVHGSVRYDARFAAKLVSLEHVRRHYRIEQVHRLAVNAHNLSNHVKHVPADGIMARGEVCHRQGGQPYLVSPGVTCATVRLVCRGPRPGATIPQECR